MDNGSKVLHCVYGYGHIIDDSEDMVRVMFTGHSMYVRQDDLIEVK